VKVVASSGSERGEHLFRFASVAADRLVVAPAVEQAIALFERKGIMPAADAARARLTELEPVS
jgi:hypothetical protein